MSNSVVKVTDSMLNDSLLLLVGEDGTVTPNKDVVEAYLSSKPGSTNLQVMHINKSDEQSVDISIDNVVYVPEAEGTKKPSSSNIDDIAMTLYNVRLDHDYTPHCGEPDEVDELAKTLSILDGDGEGDLSPLKKTESVKAEKSNKAKTVINTLNKQSGKHYPKAKVKTRHERYEDDHDYEEDAEEEEEESDYEWGEKKGKKCVKIEMKMKEKNKSPKGLKIKEEVPPAPVQTMEKSPQQDKKLVKKEKKTPKPIPDDFALFSTPDIIRRVGGKETVQEAGPSSAKPAKIENRSRSVSDSSQSPVKANRLSLDDKMVKRSDKKPFKRLSLEVSPKKSIEALPGDNMEHIATEEMRAILSDDNKSFSNSLGLESQDLSGSGDNNMTLDATGLDLDPSLLENINNDLISDDILYQVAQSLVSNTELQNAIDKSLNEENLGLEPAIQQALEPKQDESIIQNETSVEQNCTGFTSKGTQIVRPDGRIVVIPPIERPTTRSRNKRTSVEPKPSPKLTRKPLDEEHVSGNELDSSGGEEEESEDDPNKLWCICNQPHNNRFMICCDTCEEWYHGKCVNITKAMGQQMESEGREWICLFCKDPMLKRPQAAARRIRKASRNSRQSSDSTGSVKTNEATSGSVPCVVCQKPSRSNSIFCSETCILAHAQGVEKGVERVVVFERATGNMLTGNKAPSAVNLEQWLKEHPGYEVVRSAGKIVTTKPSHQNLTQSKLKLVKNSDNEGVSLAIQKKGINMGVLKHIPKHPSPLQGKTTLQQKSGIKVINKQITSPSSHQKYKIIQTSTPKKTIQTTLKPVSINNSKDKTTPPKTPKTRQNEHAATTPRAKQENIRENVQKTIFEQLSNRLKLVEDLKVGEDELKNISLEIESQLYKCFGDTGQKYRNKYRSLIFNIKDIKNQTLWRRICEKSINPYQLVRLSPDDMASQELASWRERENKHQLDMIKKSELEMLNCSRQYVLKTHKGEQILEDTRPVDTIDNSEVITSLTEGEANKKETSGKDGDRKSSKHSHRDKDRKSRSDSKDHHGHDRKRSRSHDRNRRRSRSRGRDRHKKSSHKSSRHKKENHRGSSTDKLDKKSKEILEQLVDNKIVPPLEDRLWKEETAGGKTEQEVPPPAMESDSDHEPSSTVTIPTPPRSSDAEDQEAASKKKDKVEVEERIPSSPLPKSEEIWRGVINMIDVAQISITAHVVSGDCNGLGAELPAHLDIVGRISPETVWDYIGKMKCSNSKIISVVRLNAINGEEKTPYLALYSYLSSRNRLGVVKTPNKAVKDFYILPLASQKPIPQALLPINGPGFEESRPSLLLGILVRDRRKRPLLDATSSVSSGKKAKSDTTIPYVQTTPPPRSYTPPPIKDPRLKLPLPPAIEEQDGGDEPYSPEDSDPDSLMPPSSASFLESNVSQTFQPFSNKFDDIPGLENATLPSSTQEIQRQMEKLNKEIEMQKSEINSISQNIATASTEIGLSALANITVPSNLQQILDSIKTIGSAPSTDTVETKPEIAAPAQDSPDLTIPLLLPTSFSRPLENTIPLNLPSKKKPLAADIDKANNSVLSTLSEEDLIRKAEEMLGDSDKIVVAPKRAKLELEQPPVPGLEDDDKI